MQLEKKIYYFSILIILLSKEDVKIDQYIPNNTIEQQFKKPKNRTCNQNKIEIRRNKYNLMHQVLGEL